MDDAAPTQQQLTAAAAQGHLTRALHKLLTALQPQQQQQWRREGVPAVHPGEVLSRLSWFVPEGVLEVGVQQDAAEALGVSFVGILRSWLSAEQLAFAEREREGGAWGMGCEGLLADT